LLPTENPVATHTNQRDRETHDRVLEAAARLFAARGFKNVTVREICRVARANVASVNYYFGDKAGLYRRVLAKAIETMQSTTEAAREAGQHGSPEQKLRAYVHVFVHRVVAHGRDSWIHQLMMREIAEPTEALEMVFAQVVQPRLAYVAEIVGEIIGRPPTDDVVLKCVLSIQSQCHAAMKGPVSRLLADVAGDPVALDRMADHITDFSLGGLAAIRRHPA
jgi:AcrR family transcriptional regulator